jgi:hypothetical protein
MTMDLANETPFAARILRVQRTEEEFQAVVVVKATFDADEAGRYAPAGEQVPIVGDRLETAFGVFHTDGYVRKDGVDVCVLGSLRLPRPTDRAEVKITVGSLRHELTVFGDRRWVPRGDDLAPSDAEPFDEMPLAYTHAYGGTTEHDRETFVWPDNPVGRGFYLSEEKALGGLLPNVEARDAPFVRRWQDQPGVSGWAPYPLFWGLRAREGIDVSGIPKDEVALPKIRPRLNNHAHPSLILPLLDPNTVIVLDGLRDRRLAFRLPHVRPVVEVRCGAQTYAAEGKLDGVFVWADVARVTVTHRAHFDYVFRKGEPRGARLVDATTQKRA